MCVHKKIIRNKYGREIVVNCGHCPACLQEKALNRTNRICNHIPDDDSLTTLFITLTYKNDCVPYILRSSLNDSSSDDMLFQDEGQFKAGDWVRQLDVFRDSIIPRSRESLTSSPRTYLTSFLIPAVSYDDSTKVFPALRGQEDTNKIGICYYKDIQDFFKRLRINLQRDGYSFPLSFYSCSEYGPTTIRPHFHALLFVPTSAVEAIKTAVVQAWPYADSCRTYDNIKIARKAAAYVSSYVNCSSSVPNLFRFINSLRPHHSYSHGFGVGRSHLRPQAILDCYRRRDFRQDVLITRRGVPSVESMLFPKYALCRFFRKFKGYSRLSSDEIVSVCRRPRYYLERFAERLSLSSSDIHSIVTSLNHMCDKFVATTGVSPLDWCYMYADVWKIYNSNMLSTFFSRQNECPSNILESYDNIGDVLDCKIENHSLQEIIYNLPEGYYVETDFNKFISNIVKTNSLTDAYYSYSKDRKIRNYIYADIHGDV